MATNKHTTTTDPEKSADLPPYGSRNPDPITDSPGSHPIETGIGAAIGGIASGAAVGAVGGPIGSVVGAIIGGTVAGGLAGKGIGELVDPTTEDNWLREYHTSEESNYKVKDSTPDTYRSAYRYGLESAHRHGGKSYGEVETHLRSDWDKTHAQTSGLSWDQAHRAVGHAYNKAAESGAIRLHEEKLNVGKTQQKAGEVEVRKEVITEHKTIQVPVEREEVVIERRPVSGTATGTADFSEKEIRIPVKEEHVHVSKEAVVKEEVTVGKRKVTETETVGADVKREELRVEQSGDVHVKSSGTTGGSSGTSR